MSLSLGRVTIDLDSNDLSKRIYVAHHYIEVNGARCLCIDMIGTDKERVEKFAERHGYPVREVVDNEPFNF